MNIKDYVTICMMSTPERELCPWCMIGYLIPNDTGLWVCNHCGAEFKD